MSKPIIYQMLPRLWGEGRMSSVDDATLSYLQGLGVTHLWCTGIIRHSTGQPFVKGDAGSPYAISDYYDVCPYLADVPSRRISEFRSLVRRVHSHGLRFVMDFVPNHVGCDYSDRFGGIPLCGWHDYDWSDTIKIDYSAPGTWETMYRIVRFWAAKGVDGFRCDMVELVPPEFLKWLIARIKEEFPSVIFIAEVYQKEKYRMYIEDVRFDYLYDKSGLYDVLRAVAAASGSVGYGAADAGSVGHGLVGSGAAGAGVDRLGSAECGTARAVTWNWQFLQDLQPRMLNFLENHDEQRLASPWFAGRPDYYALLCASLMLNTAPFMLYFGQETGVDASEGHEGRTTIFNFARPASLQRLCAFVHTPDCLRSLPDSACSLSSSVPDASGLSGAGESLSAKELSVLTHYRDALALAGSAAVSEGLTFDLCYCQSFEDGFDPDRHFAFLRHSAAAPVDSVSSGSVSGVSVSAGSVSADSTSAGSVSSVFVPGVSVSADFTSAGRGTTLLFVCNFSASEARMTIRIPDHAVEYLGLAANPCPSGRPVIVAPFGYVAISI